MTMLYKLLIAGCGILIAAGSSPGQTVNVFETGFEPGEGYAPGNLNGQQGWSAFLGEDPSFGQVSNANPLGGALSVRLDGRDVQLGSFGNYAAIGHSAVVASSQNGSPLRYVEVTGRGRIADPTIVPTHRSSGSVVLYNGDDWVTGFGTNSRFGQFLFGFGGLPNATVVVQPDVPFDFRHVVDYQTGLASLFMNDQVVFENFATAFDPDFIPTKIEFDMSAAGADPFDTQVWYDEMRVAATYPSLATWHVNASGNWSDPANWQAAVPNGVSATAVLASAILAPRTVTIDVPITVGNINLENPNAYTIVGNNTLTLDVVLGSASLNVSQGSHTIAAPLVLADDLDVSVAGSTDTLTVSGDITAAAGVQITKLGPGTAALKHVRADAAKVNAGTLRVLPNGSAAGTSRVKSLSVNSGGGGQGRLDLTNNGMVVDYDGVSPLTDIRALIVTGRNNGDWNGNGITSSTAAASSATHAVGYAEAAELGLTTFMGQPVDATAVVFRYTRLGDATLDAVVNLNDFNRLAANFGSTNATWSGGDFNLDGFVNLNDFNLMAANFGLIASPGGPTPEDWSALAAAVPEPGIILTVTWAAAVLGRRRVS
jgi:hypothetical protein